MNLGATEGSQEEECALTPTNVYFFRKELRFIDKVA
jgi:hypothetical protein